MRMNLQPFFDVNEGLPQLDHQLADPTILSREKAKSAKPVRRPEKKLRTPRYAKVSSY